MLFESIVQYLLADNPFLNKGFSIDELATKVGSNRTYVSNVINAESEQNFNQFVNAYRVKEAIRLLGDEEKQHLTIEGIAKEVGFSSKSSFNPAFKKFTGLTPSQYLKQKLNV